jgi:hypothetical protein
MWVVEWEVPWVSERCFYSLVVGGEDVDVDEPVPNTYPRRRDLLTHLMFTWNRDTVRYSLIFHTPQHRSPNS